MTEGVKSLSSIICSTVWDRLERTVQDLGRLLRLPLVPLLVRRLCGAQYSYAHTSTGGLLLLERGSRGPSTVTLIHLAYTVICTTALYSAEQFSTALHSTWIGRECTVIVRLKLCWTGQKNASCRKRTSLRSTKTFFPFKFSN